MVLPSQVVYVGVWIIGLPPLVLVPHIVSLLHTIVSKISCIIRNKLITHFAHHITFFQGVRPDVAPEDLLEVAP